MSDHAEPAGENPTKKKLASLLADARGNHTQVDAAPFNAFPSLESAYQVQALATEAYPSRQIGYKIGATNEGVQKLFDCNEPFYGPLFEKEQLQPGASFPLTTGVLGGEAEFAFICGSDFPTDRELSTEDLPQLIESCHIAVEIVGRRTAGTGLPGLHSAVADFGVHVAFIPGIAIGNWRSIDLAAIEVTASINGTETNSGTGAAVLGHPLNSLLWLHNALRSARGDLKSGLKAGDWVSTGTCLGVIAPTAGTVEIEFRGCGTIGYTFK